MTFLGLPDMFLGLTIFGVPSWSMLVVAVVILIAKRDFDATVGWVALYAIAYWLRAVLYGADPMLLLSMCLMILGWVMWARRNHITPFNKYGFVPLFAYIAWVVVGSVETISELLNLVVMISLAVAYVLQVSEAREQKEEDQIK